MNNLTILYIAQSLNFIILIALSVLITRFSEKADLNEFNAHVLARDIQAIKESIKYKGD